MRKWLPLTLLAVVLLFPVSVRAQSQLTIDQLDVLLWPEYDRPDMLVIYRVLISPDTSFPAQVVLRIPPSAQKPHVVAVGQTPESVSDQDIQYSTRPVDGWIEVTIQADGPAITLEYYDPAFVHQDVQRQYTYTWPGDYAVRNASLNLSLPADASEVATTPALSLQDGAWRAVYSGWEAGMPFTLETSYQRELDDLQITGSSVDLAEAPPASPLSERMLAIWPWALGILGVGLIVGGGVYYWLSGRKKKSKEHKRHAPKSGSDAGGEIHCHQCGRRANPGDRFCRDCGTRLRLPS